VVDASHPQAEEHIEAVRSVLRQLECDQKPTILVFNKVDRFRDPVEREILARKHPDASALSARSGDGIESLRRRVASHLTQHLVDVDVEIPQSEGRLLAELATWSVPIARDYVDSSVRMRLRVPKRALYKLERFRTGAADGV
jgi:GTP-binding protein HflX